jgi:hypothetical protein
MVYCHLDNLVDVCLYKPLRALRHCGKVKKKTLFQKQSSLGRASDTCNIVYMNQCPMS